MRSKGKGGEKNRSEPREADRKGEESFRSGPRGGEAYFTLWSGTSGDARLVFIAFISKDMEKRSLIPARGFTFLLPALFLRREKLYLFLTVIYRCTFLRVSFAMKARV